jgi:hypothetical protein
MMHCERKLVVRFLSVRIIACSFLAFCAAISVLLTLSQKDIDYYPGTAMATAQDNSVIPPNNINSFDKTLSDKYNKLHSKTKPWLGIVLYKLLQTHLHRANNHFFEDEAISGHSTLQNYCHYCPISDIPPPIYPPSPYLN